MATDTTTRRWRRNPSLTSGAVILGLLVLVALVAPLLLRGPAETLTGDTRLGPGAGHLLGTDAFGRDVLARALVATRLTLLMAAAATAVSFVVGVAIGALVHLAPGWLRETSLRLIDSAVAFPSLVLALVIAAVLGPGTMSAIVAIAVAGVPGFARLTANLAATVADKDYVLTARLLGVPGLRILARHVLPNISGPLLVLLSSSFTLSLLDISSLSFVGLGVQNPQYDWGRLLNEALPSIFAQPSLVLAPSIMLIVTGVGAMLLGDGVASLVDPRTRPTAPAPAKSADPAGRAVPAQKGRTPAPAADGAAAAAVPDPDGLLTVDGLTVRAGDRTLVDDVSFTIAAGQIVGLVGESGSGKSTIAMAVAGLLPEGVRADAARLALDDLDLLAAPSERRLATEIGIVYQDPIGTFNPALRLGTQLTEVTRVHQGTSRRQAAQDMVRALADIRVTEPERRLRQHPHELSGGMLQRASIASATTTNPRLLIADEPTTALDVTVQAEVLRQFRRINREHGTAMLFISHDIGVVGVLCDTVLVLHGGRVVDRTTGADLRRGTVTHPYTRALLAATPAAVEAGGTLTAVRWTADAHAAPPGGAPTDDCDLSDTAADRSPAAEGSH
ncbi:putative oligopeptide transport system (integral membrane and ATP-binding proteins) [Streptomyces scabiei 87.22]|uniref:Putative oligopeptide transport system (Integral membrane and ATP-binding proteins) n=3 Tax=Streptomyces scabiei TaxID=1930 RepID=C9YSQ9_STRSW|nr:MULTISPECIES: dipeptide/oligopeptide/nickel ABC transporter permease/ATP-binding protein [Streptomyces]MBP5871993.1 dipeptide/oligopeptide/nickel ABC transporter permease/ATP-binding protein [Streptomyces sp. LBUM 1485]MBP5934466.1 dipeptide/oligopeptide/nickel ABC transporter permease/ATP-binding protein [Streptomyces sp. LBUM 1479]MBP5911953.1 dipeptide/oligopeptide/nickel ABC transporter permease/ATP-binding protein [Streptomyces sp. LBUM 1486]MDX2536145.1 dipeptide/oligopeptide/nickel AB